MVNDQYELAEQFLLGKLTDDQRSEIEIDFLQSSSSFENILIAENALTDAYVAGRLSADDRSLFEQRLLVNPRQRERVAFAKALIKYASSLPVDDTTETSPTRWATTLVRLLSGRPLASYSLGAAVLFIIAGSAFWWMSGNSSSADPEIAGNIAQTSRETSGNNSEQVPTPEVKENIVAEIASNPEGGLPTKARPSRKTKPAGSNSPSRMISTIILSLGSTRDAGTAKAYILPRGTSAVRLQIAIENDAFPNYFAVVETVDGQQVWSGKVSQSRPKTAQNISVTVPGARLKGGDYIVTLKGSASGTYETIGEYSFAIERR